MSELGEKNATTRVCCQTQIFAFNETNNGYKVVAYQQSCVYRNESAGSHERIVSVTASTPRTRATDTVSYCGQRLGEKTINKITRRMNGGEASCHVQQQVKFLLCAREKYRAL